MGSDRQLPTNSVNSSTTLQENKQFVTGNCAATANDPLKIDQAVMHGPTAGMLAAQQGVAAKDGNGKKTGYETPVPSELQSAVISVGYREPVCSRRIAPMGLYNTKLLFRDRCLTRRSTTVESDCHWLIY